MISPPSNGSLRGSLRRDKMQLLGFAEYALRSQVVDAKAP